MPGILFFIFASCELLTNYFIFTFHWIDDNKCILKIPKKPQELSLGLLIKQNHRVVYHLIMFFLVADDKKSDDRKDGRQCFYIQCFDNIVSMI